MATVGVILALWARHAWRAAVREELLDYLAHAAPEVAITDVHVGSLVYQAREGAALPRTIALDAFYRQLGAHPGGDRRGRGGATGGLRGRRHHDARPRQPRAGR